MITVKKVYPPLLRYCAKVIPLAFDESLSYYECICNIAYHINDELIPKINECIDSVNDLKDYVNDNMLTKDVNDLTYYTLSSDLSSVATSGDYDDLINKPTIPDVSDFITKDVNDLTYYTLTSNLSSVATSGSYNDLTNKPTIPDVSNFITKDVNNLTYYTLTSSLSSVATSGSYNDLTNTPTIPDVSNFITKDVNDLTYYTDTTSLTTLLSGKENAITIGSNTNGNYIKFDNGILICYGYVSNSMTRNTALTSGGYRTGGYTITFPETFISTPNVSITDTSSVNNSNGVRCGNSSITTTECSISWWGINSSSTSTSYSAHFIAIGKWK